MAIDTTSSLLYKSSMRRRKTCYWLCIVAIIVTLSNHFIVNILPLFKRIQFRRIFDNRDGGQNSAHKEHNFSPIQIDDLQVYVYSAVVHSRTTDQNFIDVRIQAVNGDHLNHALKCCFPLDDGLLQSVNASLMFRFPLGELKSSVYRCYLPRPTSSIRTVFVKQNCSTTKGQELAITYPEKPKGLLSICIHAVYGYIDPELVTEWMEVLQLQGVRRVFVYPLENAGRIDSRTLNVLKYYEKRGLVHLFPYQLAELKGNLSTRFVNRDGQMYSDEILPVYDCLMRSSDYTYTAVIDFDEIIVPEENPLDLIPMLNRQYDQTNDAAGFSFRVENFIFNWTKSNNESDLIFMQYVNRTRAISDRSKTVYIQGRYKSVYMHSMEPLKGYKTIHVPPKTAALHHYTNCRSHWNNITCISLFNRTVDSALLKFKHVLTARMKHVPYNIRVGNPG